MDRKDAIRYGDWTGSLDDAIKFLYQAREIGKNIYCTFRGHDLYSADVTVDSAYTEVYGMDLAAFNKKREEEREELNRKREKEKAEAQAKVPYWKEEGNKYIPQGLWWEWEKSVEIDAVGMYNGTIIEDFLDIVKAIELGQAKTAEDVEKMLIAQNHSNGYGMVKDMLKTFSEKYCKLNNLETFTEKEERNEKEEEEEEKENEKEEEEEKEKEERKEKNKKKKKEEREKKEEQDKRERMENYMAEGKKYVPKEFWHDWEQFVWEKMNSRYEDVPILGFLIIVKEIENGTIKTKKDAIERLNEDPEFDPYGMIRDALDEFSKDFVLLPWEDERE